MGVHDGADVCAVGPFILPNKRLCCHSTRGTRRKVSYAVGRAPCYVSEMLRVPIQPVLTLYFLENVSLIHYAKTPPDLRKRKPSN